MVSTKFSKYGLGLLCSVAILSGCTTTGSESEGVTQGPGTTTGGERQTVNVDREALTIFYFEFDQATLNSEARQELTIHAEVLKRAPRNIRLEGHADERGTREYNMALGERRANAVRDFLVLNGVDGSLIEVISYGEEQPAAYGQDEMSYQKNRRVELK